MVIDPLIVESVRKALEEAQPLMDVARVKTDVVSWLCQLKLPVNRDKSSWEQLVETFPADPDEQKETAGTRMRVSFHLHTTNNRYLVALLESLVPSARGVYTAAVFVNSTEEERQMKKLVEEAYQGGFADLPGAANVLWAQTVRHSRLADALNACSLAILGHELVGKPVERSCGESLKKPPATDPEFPAPRRRADDGITPE